MTFAFDLFTLAFELNHLIGRKPMINRHFNRVVAPLSAALVLCLVLGAQQPPQEKVDLEMIAKIKAEGLERSQVMETLSYLTDVYGPRLTGSPNMKKANEWTRDTLAKWGLQNAHLEAWGPFGRGWSLKRFSAQVTDPLDFPLIAYPKAWSPGTNGPVMADVVYFDAKDEADMARFKGQLKGKIVLTQPLREVKAHFETQGSRLDEKRLLALANSPMPRPAGRGGFGGARNADFIAAAQLAAKKNQFLVDEGAAVLVDSSRGDGGKIFGPSATVPQPFNSAAFCG